MRNLSMIEKFLEGLLEFGTPRPCSIGSNCFNRNQFWLKQLRFPVEHFFNHSWLTRDWQDGGRATRGIDCPSRTVRRIGSTTFELDDELEYMATLLLETEMTPATRITGYLKNVVPNLSDSKFRSILGPLFFSVFLHISFSRPLLGGLFFKINLCPAVILFQ